MDDRRQGKAGGPGEAVAADTGAPAGVVPSGYAAPPAEALLKLQHDLALALGASESLSEALELLLDAACDIPGIDAGAVYLVEEKTGDLCMACQRNLTSAFVDSARRFGADSPQAQITRTGKPHYLRYADAHFADPVRRDAGFDALVILPIFSGGRGVAVVNAASRTLGEIPESIRNVLETIAAQLGPIVARLRSAEALRVSEARFRSVVEASKDAIVALDRTGCVTVFNPAAERMFGWTREEIVGGKPDRLMPAEYRARHALDVASYFAGGKPNRAVGQTVEFPALHRDGHRFTIELSLSSGMLAGAESVVAVMRDVTARKRSEGELLQFKTISDRANYGAAIVDPEGYVTYANDAYAEMHGYGAAELLGKHLSMFHTDEQMSAVEDLYRKVQTASGYSAEEVWHRRRDGSEFLTLMSGIAIRDAAGQPQYFASTAIDITSRKHAEEAVRESEERYRTLLENITDGVILMVDGTVQYANRSFCEILGRGVDEIVGMPVYELVAPEYREFTRQRVRDRMRNLVPPGSEYEVERPDGSRRHIEAVSSLIQKEGRPALLAVIRDITLRKQNEAEKKRLAEQLQEARRLHAIGEVAARIAHDFSNLLVVMRRALAKLNGHVPEDQSCLDVLHTLQQALDEADHTTKTLMTFARRVPAERQPLNLCALVSDSLRILQHLLPSNVRLATRISEAPNCVIRGDAGQLQHLLLNLTLNACDAMDAGGEFFVGVELSEGRRPEVCMTVRDTGCGMPPDVLARAFEPLFTTKAIGEGTGLGLTAVRNIVAEHDGRIDVRSQPGGGTTFAITFPVLEREEPELQLRGRGERIVVVDSSRHVRRLLFATLQDWGFEAEVCEPEEIEPDEAGRLFASAAVLILNVDAPDEKNVAVCRRMREAGLSTPIILTTESSPPADLDVDGDARLVVLDKPFQMPALGAALKKLLRESVARRDG